MNHDKIKRIKPIGDNWTLEQAKAAFNELLSALQEEESIITSIPAKEINGIVFHEAENSAPELSLEQMIERCGKGFSLEYTSDDFPESTKWIACCNFKHGYIVGRGPTPTEAVKNLLKEMGK